MRGKLGAVALLITFFLPACTLFPAAAWAYPSIDNTSELFAVRVRASSSAPMAFVRFPV